MHVKIASCIVSYCMSRMHCIKCRVIFWQVLETKQIGKYLYVPVFHTLKVHVIKEWKFGCDMYAYNQYPVNIGSSDSQRCGLCGCMWVCWFCSIKPCVFQWVSSVLESARIPFAHHSISEQAVQLIPILYSLSPAFVDDFGTIAVRNVLFANILAKCVNEYLWIM